MSRFIKTVNKEIVFKNEKYFNRFLLLYFYINYKYRKINIKFFIKESAYSFPY